MRTRMIPLLAGLVALAPLAASASPGGYLGVRMQSIEGGLAEALDLEENAGVLLGQVVDDSPAAKAGLENGDIVTAIDGAAVDSPGAIHRIVRDHEPGDEILIAYLRDGKSREAKVLLGEPTRARRHARMARDLRIGRDHGFLGVVTQPLSEELGEYFGVEGGRGALVSEVVEDSPAAKLGLEAGDVVTAVDGHDVADPQDLREIVSEFEEETEVEVVWVRDKRRETGKTTLEIREGRQMFGMHGFPGGFDVRRHVDDGMRWFHDERVQEQLDDAMRALREELDEIRAEIREIREESKAD